MLMKKIFTLLFAASALMASAEGTGIYLTGTMNDWAKTDAAWELQPEPDMPGWAYIDLTDMPGGTEFRIVGHGRDFGMKNTRNIIRQNSLHLPTEGGTYNLTACDEGLDGVHLLVLTEDFETSRYGSIITRTSATETIYGACKASSVEPVVLAPLPGAENIVAGEVELTEPWYVIKAYKLSNATQSVTSYGLSAPGSTQLVPTSFIAPTADPIPVPADGEGTYMVEYNTATMVYGIGTGSLGVEGVEVSGVSEAVYYNLQGVRVENPDKGIYIMIRDGRASKVMR